MRKKILEALLEKYEKSKTYKGENKVNQKFTIAPEDVFPIYSGDFTDLEKIQEFENQVKDMEEEGLVSVEWSGFTIKQIVAAPGRLEDYYQILGRKPKRDIESAYIALYEKYIGFDPLLDRFCAAQVTRVRSHKYPRFTGDNAENYLKFLRAILCNKDDILERELSIVTVGNSKKWGDDYRTRVCSVLREYGDFEDILAGAYDSKDKEDQRQIERIILGEYNVYSNPSYVYFKGNAILKFEGERDVRIYEGFPVAFSSKALDKLQSVRVAAPRVMTVENVTSFNRMEESWYFLIFLSGYHNSAKQALIKKIAENNPELQWFHFGDIDPDGFYILENLRRGTGLDFQPVRMDIGTLEAYKDYAKPLEDNDVRKAKSLVEAGKWQEVAQYMLDNNVKLEQEIVSWKESSAR